MREFLDGLLRAELLAAGEVEKTYGELQAANLSEDAAVRIAWLVDHQRLTPWQASEFLAGRRSFRCGAYELVDQISVTPVATIYKGRHCRTGWVAVLKVLSAEVQQDEGVAGRFEREIQLASQLDHPNIVTVYDAELGDAGRFLAMEFIEGQTLAAWHERHKPLAIDWVVECCRQVAVGLEHAHQHGLVHRDIQPANLLVVAKDFRAMPHVKIVDFGLARTLSETWMGRNLTKPGELLGTPDYISPEQAQDAHQANIRADIYSLGCVLFHLLTDQTPFAGATPVERVMARMNQTPPACSSLRRGLPAGLDEVVAMMLARDPKDRYDRPSEVVEALEPFTGAYGPRD